LIFFNQLFVRSDIVYLEKHL